MFVCLFVLKNKIQIALLLLHYYKEMMKTTRLHEMFNVTAYNHKYNTLLLVDIKLRTNIYFSKKHENITYIQSGLCK